MRVAIRTGLASFGNASASDGGDDNRPTTTTTVRVVGRRRFAPMATVLLALVLAICACSSVDALRCYCTTSKGAADCDDGVCEIDVDSTEDAGGRPACAALNHSISGVHYACVRSKTEADETTCKVGPTGNGGTVTACWCRDVDFCNQKLFDRTLMDTDSSSDDFSAHLSSVERSDHSSVEQHGRSSVEQQEHFPIGQHGSSLVEHDGHSSVEQHGRSPAKHDGHSSVEHHEHFPIEQHGHSPIEQHEQPVDNTDIEITAAKMDDIDNVDEAVTLSNKFEYSYDDEDDDDGEIAVGNDNDDYEDDKDEKEDEKYYENSADPFVEHTNEHTSERTTERTTTSTTEREPDIFASTPSTTFYPRMFTSRKPTTTLYWRPSAPTTTTTPSTTTATTTTSTSTTTKTTTATTSTTTTKPPTTTATTTTARTTTTPRTTTTSSTASTTTSQATTSSVDDDDHDDGDDDDDNEDDSRFRSLPDGSSSESGEKRIKAIHPSPVQTITQSVPRANYGTLTTTDEPPRSIIGEGVDSRANGQKGYGDGVNSRNDADHSESPTSRYDGGRIDGGRVYRASSCLTVSQSLLSGALAILSILPVLL